MELLRQTVIKSGIKVDSRKCVLNCNHACGVLNKLKEVKKMSTTKVAVN